MTVDLPSLEMATRVILDTSPWKHDFDVLEIPWRDDQIQAVRNRTCRRGESDGKLTFGVMSCDEVVQPHPPVKRAIKLVTQALLERGYEVSGMHVMSNGIALILLGHRVEAAVTPSSR